MKRKLAAMGEGFLQESASSKGKEKARPSIVSPIQRVQGVLEEGGNAETQTKRKRPSFELPAKQQKLIQVLKELCKLRAQQGFADSNSVFIKRNADESDVETSSQCRDGIEQLIWLDEYAKAVALCQTALKANIAHPYHLVTKVLEHNLEIHKRKRGAEEERDERQIERKKKVARIDDLPSAFPYATGSVHNTNPKNVARGMVVTTQERKEKPNEEDERGQTRKRKLQQEQQEQEGKRGYKDATVKRKKASVEKRIKQEKQGRKSKKRKKRPEAERKGGGKDLYPIQKKKRKEEEELAKRKGKEKEKGT